MSRIPGLHATILALSLTIAVVMGAGSAAEAAEAPTFGHAMLGGTAAGDAMLRVDGKPFFFVGGAFFYERIPRSRWRLSMERMREIGANTIDLYVPWNWHELADGDFDFEGRTSPRRDLREVLRLGKELGFYFIVRPGPVIRNEWRNGGYPAWLLQRPEYGMPLHDVLEGRYPATATLQNQHSDAAAAEWMANGTHMTYASRWLHRALEEFRPVADRVLAVQLDDDQGAYLDNDTYPAPHLHAYLDWLQAQVREVVGPVTPTFINTFEMKVPSSSPVWAMGNWYQSDAYAIGEHDRAELAFATATLRTQRDVPLAYSEFQAGWLAGPEDPKPRPADPTNTALAIGELTGWGLKGIVDFPLQDTLAPFGWEAPFSNALYAWDAAYDITWLTRSPLNSRAGIGARWWATRRMLQALRFYGPVLEEARRIAPVALLYDGRGDAYAAAGAVKTDLAACRAAGVSCDVLDPKAADDARLRAYRFVVVHPGSADAFASRARALRVRVIASVREATDRGATAVTMLHGAHGTFAIVENWGAATRRVDPRSWGAAFTDVAPFVMRARDVRIVAAGVDLAFVSTRYRAGDELTTSCALSSPNGSGVPTFTTYGPTGPGTADPDGSESCSVRTMLRGKSARYAVPWGRDAALGAAPAIPPSDETAVVTARIPIAPQNRFAVPASDAPPLLRAVVSPSDLFQDGLGDIVLRNDRVQAVIVPNGGARVVVFAPPLRAGEDLRTAGNAFDATGALRDDVLVQLPPSTSDRIAKYTHTYPAGMFNRAYAARTFDDGRRAGASLVYDAPDVAPSGARFERAIWLTADADRLVADERFTPREPGDPAQRLVSLSSLRMLGMTMDDGIVAGSSDKSATIDPRASGVTFTGPAYGVTGMFSVAWHPGDVESATWTPAQSNGTLRLVFSPSGWKRVTFAESPLRSPADARAWVKAERAWVAANPGVGP